VNNAAAGQSSLGVGPASARKRSCLSHLRKIKSRLPIEPEKHNVVVLDAGGKVLEKFEIQHSASGWQQFRQRLAPYGSIPIAIETNQGAAVEQLVEAELFARHPDHDLFGSLPGAGPKIAPRLMSEIGDNRARFDKGPEALQCLAGTAPVTIRTGKAKTDPPRWPCHQRWACNTHLRHALHLFTQHTLSRCVWAQIDYQHHRDKGRTHSDCLRRLAQRWLKIIYRMWIDRKPYDPMLHHQNQLKHGSWVLQLNPQK
jgi:hypothetical protein